MTHDELLARIDANFQGIEVDSKHISAEIVNAWHKALHAVVELHKPFTDYGDETCTECQNADYSNKDQPYPCKTIQAIEKALI